MCVESLTFFENGVLGWAEKYLFVEIQKSTYPISCLLDQN